MQQEWITYKTGSKCSKKIHHPNQALKKSTINTIHRKMILHMWLFNRNTNTNWCASRSKNAQYYTKLATNTQQIAYTILLVRPNTSTKSSLYNWHSTRAAINITNKLVAHFFSFLFHSHSPQAPPKNSSSMRSTHTQINFHHQNVALRYLVVKRCISHKKVA